MQSLRLHQHRARGGHDRLVGGVALRPVRAVSSWAAGGLTHGHGIAGRMVQPGYSVLAVVRLLAECCAQLRDGASVHRPALHLHALLRMSYFLISII